MLAQRLRMWATDFDCEFKPQYYEAKTYLQIHYDGILLSELIFIVLNMLNI